MSDKDCLISGTSKQYGLIHKKYIIMYLGPRLVLIIVILAKEQIQASQFSAIIYLDLTYLLQKHCFSSSFWQHFLHTWNKPIR